MPVVGILAVRLTGPGRQQVLQGPKAVLNPTAPLPRPGGSEGQFFGQVGGALFV
jgi:hypothetical protein